MRREGHLESLGGLLLHEPRNHGWLAPRPRSLARDANGFGGVICPKCKGPTRVLKTEPIRSGGTARLRRCDRDGRFWTTANEKLDHWLPATATDSAGNGYATAIADSQPLGGRGGLPLVISSNSRVTPEPDRASSKPSDARAMSTRFPEFWALYPRRVARIKAEEIWIKRKLDQHADVIIAAIQLQAPDFLAREPDKVPHAATWLNQERWKDEIDRRPRPVGRPARSDGNIEHLSDWLEATK